MLIDLVSTHNQITFNIYLANILGLHSAIYLAELERLVGEASACNALKDGFLMLDRNRIKSDTCIIEAEQLAIDKKLQSANLIIKDDSNNNAIKLNLNLIINLFNDADEAILAKITKITEVKNTTIARTGKLTQRDAQCNMLKSKIICANEELLEAYRSWVDGVYANPRGFLSVRAINIFQKAIDDFAQGNLDLALKIIDIATVNGYREAQWAINLFNKDYAKAFNKQFMPITPKAKQNTNLIMDGDEF